MWQLNLSPSLMPDLDPFSDCNTLGLELEMHCNQIRVLTYFCGNRWNASKLQKRLRWRTVVRVQQAASGEVGDWSYTRGKTASEFSSRQQRPPHWGRGAHPPHPGRQHLHFYSFTTEPCPTAWAAHSGPGRRKVLDGTKKRKVNEWEKNTFYSFPTALQFSLNLILRS